MQTLLTAKDLAARWSVPLSSIYKLNHYGKGVTPIHIGKRVRYRLEDVESYERAN